MSRKIKIPNRWSTYCKIWKSIPIELRVWAVWPFFEVEPEKHMRTIRTEHLVEAWLNGGKERYERTGNPFAKPRYRPPPKLYLEEKN